MSFAVPCILVGIMYVLLTLFVLPKLIEKEEGPNTKSQIIHSFQNALVRNYNLIILGNSGTYRGINPDIINIPSYNFSHDNDTYNQLYYKLIWLEQKNKKFKYLVLGVDYFQFSFISDTRNYLYSPLFDIRYSEDYPEQNCWEEFIARTNVFNFKRVGYLLNVFKKKQNLIFQKENGQYIRPPKETKDMKTIVSINRLPIQEKYFKMILDNCSKNEIEVFLCMLPVRKKVLTNYKESEIKEFNDFICSYINNGVHFLNYSFQDGWNPEDYTDMIHLNAKAADRFSEQLNDTINKIANRNN